MTAPKPEHPLDRGTRESVDERQRFGEVLIGAMRREWFADGIHFGYRYDDSPVCVPDRDAPAPPDEPGRYIPSSIPGGRAPHAWLPDGRSTLDLFGDGYVLLEFGEAAGTAATAGFTARAIPLSIVRIEDAEIARLYERRFVLVRPDGHVAWRGDLLPEDIDSLLARVTGRAPSATASPVSRIA